MNANDQELWAAALHDIASFGRRYGERALGPSEFNRLVNRAHNRRRTVEKRRHMLLRAWELRRLLHIHEHTVEQHGGIARMDPYAEQGFRTTGHEAFQQAKHLRSIIRSWRP